MDELLDSAAVGDLPLLEAVLQRPQDPNVTGKDDWTALHHAANSGNITGASLLLEARADVGLFCAEGRTCLHWACRNSGRVDTVCLLLLAAADQNEADIYRKTPLYLASREGHTDVVGLLLGAGANMDAREERGKNALHVACRAGHEDIAKMLLQATADKDLADASGRTALHEACFVKAT